MEEILTLSELVELYRKGEIKAEGWYMMYPTELHKKNNSIGFIPSSEIEKLSGLHKSIDEEWNKFIWTSLKH